MSRLSQAVTISISPGELVDRLTIVRIKSQRLTRVEQLERVRAELESLQGQWAGIRPLDPILPELEEELSQVNSALWEIEDELRLCEARFDFGPAFVRLARLVYLNNDRRASLKARVNQLLDSSLCEDKCYAASTSPIEQTACAS